MNRWTRPTHPRALWLALYVVVNIVCGVIIYSGNRLLGETQELRLSDRAIVFSATAIVVLSYIVLLAVIYPLMTRVNIAPRVIAGAGAPHDRATGILLFVLQLCFIAFFESTGTFVAGSTERSDSVFSVVWVIVGVDSLFFIYYGFYRESRLFWPNLAIAIVSNLMRGWTGIFILVAFIESARAMRRGTFSLKILAPVALVLVLAYPVVNLVKLQVRFMSSAVAQDVSFVQLASSTLADLGPSDYVDLIEASGESLLARMHLVSNTIAVQQLHGELAGAIRSGEIEPFWKEGIYGIAYDRLTGSAPRFDIGVELAYAIDSDQEEGSWNSNPGYASWLMLAPESAPLYIGYTFGLMFLCVVIVKRLGGSTATFDMLWFACLGFLIPGWTGSFILFFNSLLMFYAWHALAARAAPRRAVLRATAG